MEIQNEKIHFKYYTSKQHTYNEQSKWESRLYVNWHLEDLERGSTLIQSVK